MARLRRAVFDVGAARGRRTARVYQDADCGKKKRESAMNRCVVETSLEYFVDEARVLPARKTSRERSTIFNGDRLTIGSYNHTSLDLDRINNALRKLCFELRFFESRLVNQTYLSMLAYRISLRTAVSISSPRIEL